MATFTSSVQVDLINFQNLTSGTSYFPMIGAGVATYFSPLTNTSFNAAGATLISLLGGATGTATEIYGYTGAPVPVTTEPVGTTIKFTGITADASDVNGFLTSVSQLTSLAFLSTVLAGDDSITGSSFDDTLFGGLGADTIDGGIGTDTVSYFNSMEGVVVSLASGLGSRGEAQGDTLTGIENLEGSSFGDTLVGDGFANTLNGGGGNDVLIGGGGGDVLKGDLGIDTASYSTSASSVFVDLNLGLGLTNDAVGDSYFSIENVIGTNSADIISGDSGANRLQGLDGDDSLDGGGGNDTLIGEAGSDTLTGGEGDDVLQGGADSDFLYGNVGADRLVGGAGVDQMEGGDGNDSYEVDNEDDLIVEVAGEGSDRVVSTAGLYTLGENIEVLILGDGAVLGTGNSGNNTIRGNADSNALSGAAGNDTLQGMAGDDNLIGGAGADRLYGGAGADLFTFNGPSDGVDRICDWEDGDRFEIDVNAFGLSVASGLNVVNGTSASVLTEDSVFYNTATGRLYAYDADTDSLTQFVAFTASKPLSLDSTDFALIS
ncbi:MAG: calcium-binding protein [Zavarzinia sp.]|nr:calcium-binding protein [Zavarzinia sp.]